LLSEFKDNERVLFQLHPAQEKNTSVARGATARAGWRPPRTTCSSCAPYRIR